MAKETPQEQFMSVLTYRMKLTHLRDARNRIRSEAQALRNKMREHNRLVEKAFGPREIDSHVRGSLMVDVFGEV